MSANVKAPTKNGAFAALAAIAIVAAAGLGACSSKGTMGSGGGTAPALDCPQDKEFFRTRIWEPVMSVQCIACHNASGLAKGTHFVLEPESNPDALDLNYATARSVAQIEYNGTSVLLLRPTGKFPEGHAGGTLIADGSATYTDFKTFADRANGLGTCAGSTPASCDPASANAGARVLRRLTRFEYDNTLRDLMQIAPKYGDTFPPDDVVNGFDNNAAALHVAPIYTDKARSAAEDIAANLTLAGFVPCDPATGDAACAAKLVTSFGARAFRRPVTDGETQRYAALYSAIAKTDGFDGGIRAIVTAMLQSPSFLYRTEIGTLSGNVYALTPYEIASELSYLLTGSMPDAALFAAAASGELAKPEAIAAQAKRLLHSDASKTMLEHFVRQWLELDRLAIAVKDPATYPSFTPAVRDAMYAETVAYFANTMRADGATMPQLLTGTTTWASAALAQFYGFGAATGAADSNGLKPYAMGSDRLGILTQGSILATMAKTDRPSPVQRGKLVRERLFCQTLAPPPPGVNTQLPAVDPNVSNRERFSEHSKNQPCASCHQLMDPIGFGFEGFDGIGRPVGGGIDTSGEIVGTTSTNGTFDGVPALAKTLAASTDVQSCFALEWYRFAYGLDETKDTSCGAPQVVSQFMTNKLSLEALALSLTQSDHFMHRVADDATNDPAPPATTDGGAPVTSGDSGAPTPPPASNVTVSTHQDSSWATGYCDTVTVTNSGSAPVDWTAHIPSDGTITQVWSAIETTSGGDWVFTGVDFNRTLAPAATASFGFCASK